FVEQDKLRIDVGFDRKLVEQARAESVDRGNYRAFEGTLVAQPLSPLITFGFSQEGVYFGTDTFAHLVGCSIGERDSNDVINRNFLSTEDFQVSLDKDSGFAGAGSGSYREVTIEGVRG